MRHAVISFGKLGAPFVIGARWRSWRSWRYRETMLIRLGSMCGSFHSRKKWARFFCVAFLFILSFLLVMIFMYLYVFLCIFMYLYVSLSWHVCNNFCNNLSLASMIWQGSLGFCIDGSRHSLSTYTCTMFIDVYIIHVYG